MAQFFGNDQVPEHGEAAPPGDAEDAVCFLPGEAVVYRAHGVGRVDRIGDRLVGTDTLEMIQVSFPGNALLLLIPRHTAARSGLRHVSSREIADAAFRTVVDRQRILRGVWAKKSEAILRKINSGRLDHLAEVVRDLRHHVRPGTGSFSERQLFEAALDRFTAEMAVVTGDGGPNLSIRIRTLLLGVDAEGAGVVS